MLKEMSSVILFIIWCLSKITANGFQLQEVRNLPAQNCLTRKTLLNVLKLIANAKNVARSAPLKKYLQLAESPHLA
jgi:hypothetical protein